MYGFNGRPSYIPDEIISKGLDSPNDYVRYLCANSFFCWSDVEKQSEIDKKRLKKISNDKSTIVRFTHCPSKEVHVHEKNKDGHNILVLKPENFFDMAHEEQYLYFNALRVSDGEKISQILEWGFNHEVEHQHLAYLVEELEHGFNQYKSDQYISDDGFSEFFNAKGLKALWQLIPKLGDTEPARYLVWSLPTSVFFNDDIINDVINKSPKKLIIYLLERNDFYCFELRKNISASKNKLFDEEVKTAAASKLMDPKIIAIKKRKHVNQLKPLY